jgi:hypothetical protein
MNASDPSQASDAALLTQWLEGRVREGDPRMDELFRRRPQWRELSEISRGGLEHERTAALRESASEADRRLVAECFAEARARAPSIAFDASATARAASTTRRWPRVVLAVAALLLVSWLARMWRLGERSPDHEPRKLLGSGAPVDLLEAGEVAPDFSSFAWKDKQPKSGSDMYDVTFWAAEPGGARGARLHSDKTHERRLVIAPEKRAGWPPAVIWRVDREDSSGVPSFGPEWLAQRAH